MDAFPSVIQRLILDYWTVFELIESDMEITLPYLKDVVSRMYAVDIDQVSAIHLAQAIRKRQLNSHPSEKIALDNAYIAVVLLDRHTFTYAESLGGLISTYTLKTRLRVYPHLFKLIGNVDGFVYQHVLVSEISQPDQAGVELVYAHMVQLGMGINDFVIIRLAKRQPGVLLRHLDDFFINPYIIEALIDDNNTYKAVLNRLVSRLLFQTVPDTLKTNDYRDSLQLLMPMLKRLRFHMPDLYTLVKQNAERLDYIMERGSQFTFRTTQDYIDHIENG